MYFKTLDTDIFLADMLPVNVDKLLIYFKNNLLQHMSWDVATGYKCIVALQ